MKQQKKKKKGSQTAPWKGWNGFRKNIYCKTCRRMIVRPFPLRRVTFHTTVMPVHSPGSDVMEHCIA